MMTGWDVQHDGYGFVLERDGAMHRDVISISPAGVVIDARFVALRDAIDRLRSTDGTLPGSAIMIDVNPGKDNPVLSYGDAMSVTVYPDSSIKNAMGWERMHWKTSAVARVTKRADLGWATVTVQINLKSMYKHESFPSVDPVVIKRKLRASKKAMASFSSTWNHDFITFHVAAGDASIEHVDRDHPPRIVIESLNPNFFFNDSSKTYTFEYNPNTLPSDVSKIPCRYYYAPGHFTFVMRDEQDPLTRVPISVDYPRMLAWEQIKFSYSSNVPFKWIKNFIAVYGIVEFVNYMISTFSIPDYTKWYVIGPMIATGIIHFIMHVKKVTGEDKAGTRQRDKKRQRAARRSMPGRPRRATCPAPRL